MCFISRVGENGLSSINKFRSWLLNGYPFQSIVRIRRNEELGLSLTVCGLDDVLRVFDYPLVVGEFWMCEGVGKETIVPHFFYHNGRMCRVHRYELGGNCEMISSLGNPAIGGIKSGVPRLIVQNYYEEVRILLGLLLHFDLQGVRSVSVIQGKWRFWGSFIKNGNVQSNNEMTQTIRAVVKNEQWVTTQDEVITDMAEKEHDKDWVLAESVGLESIKIKILQYELDVGAIDPMESMMDSWAVMFARNEVFERETAEMELGVGSLFEMVSFDPVGITLGRPTFTKHDTISSGFLPAIEMLSANLLVGIFYFIGFGFFAVEFPCPSYTYWFTSHAIQDSNLIFEAVGDFEGMVLLENAKVAAYILQTNGEIKEYVYYFVIVIIHVLSIASFEIHGSLVNENLQCYVWDPGWGLILFYILEDKDVLKMKGLSGPEVFNFIFKLYFYRCDVISRIIASLWVGYCS